MSRSFPLSLCAVLAACAFTTATVAQAGPAGAVVSTRLRSPHAYPGSLIVYTARMEVNDGDILYYPHSSYEIRTLEGKHLRGVRNHLGNNDEDPEMVELPAGKYVVVADSERDGRVSVPVTVKPGGATLINLQRDRPARLPLAFR